MRLPRIDGRSWVIAPKRPTDDTWDVLCPEGDVFGSVLWAELDGKPTPIGPVLQVIGGGWADDGVYIIDLTPTFVDPT